MGFPKKISFLIAFLTTFLTLPAFSQIVFKELPGYKFNNSDSLFLGLTQTRSVIPLDGRWQVRPENKKAASNTTVGVPSVFQGDADLIFEKRIPLSPSLIKNHQLTVVFLGLNYTADISLNKVIIHRHSGGSYPFKVNLPRDILTPDKDNLLMVELHYKLDSENTIPLEQRFLFPKDFGGIIGDVYIEVTPNVSITSSVIKDDYNPKTDRVSIKINARIENKESQESNDSLEDENSFTFKVKLTTPDGSNSTDYAERKFQLPFNKEEIIQDEFELRSPAIWSPSNPAQYKISLEVWRDKELIDEKRQELGVYDLTISKKNIFLNKDTLQLNGVTFISSHPQFGPLATDEQMERDIKLIKQTGFNSVRFEKSVPNPYYIYLCGRYGLLAFVEIPLNSVPGQLTEDQNFITRSKNYLTNFIKAYEDYPAVAAIGVGGSYLPSLPAHIDFIQRLAGIIKKESGLKTYASFANPDLSEIENLDLYGIELFNNSIDRIDDQLKADQDRIGRAKVFISEATYVVNVGNTNGYVNNFSYEAQAKYFEDLLNYSDQNFLAGYFINSMFDYNGDFASLISGYNNENLYNIGIASEYRNTNRISYSVISSTLRNTEKVTIPIGSKKNDAPMSFILIGLLLALLIGILVNSGRKFREDSSRALMRPYNFFADVRDQRIISGYHSTILGLVISAVGALIIGNLLYFFRLNIIFEKMLLDLGSRKLMEVVSYLSWNPVQSFLWLMLAFIAFLIILIIIIKAASFFVRNKVYYENVFFTVIWSFLPLIILIPVGIILYRMLNAEVANFYIYLGLFLFVVWIIYRLIKGIYVIFDVNPGGIYFYSLLVIAVVIGGVLLFFQLKNSFFDYLQLTLEQYKIF
jgi:beta-galactosidase